MGGGGMISLMGIIFMIVAGGLAVTMSGWAIPWLILGCTAFWFADDWDWDMDMLGGIMIMLMVGVAGWAVLIGIAGWLYDVLFSTL